MKITIIGGSSQSTPNLFACDAIVPVSDELQVVLVGRSMSKLAAVTRAITQLTIRSQLRVEFADVQTALADSLRSASMVILQARYGGYNARNFDETFPQRYGVPGDEGLGPSGLANAWRSWPEIKAVLDEVEKSAPSAVVLLMTSPLGLLTRCALRAFPSIKLYGICELPYLTLLDACKSARVDIESAAYEYMGINHIGWLYGIRAGATDVVKAYAGSRAGSDFPNRQIVERFDAIPLGYLRLEFARDEVLREQQQRGSRARELQCMEARTLPTFELGSMSDIAAALKSRPAPWYSHAVGPFIASMIEGSSSIPFSLTTRNDDYCGAFRSDDVLEIPYRLKARALVRVGRPATTPPVIVNHVTSYVRYERAAAKAVQDRSVVGIAQALSLHPWVGNVAYIPELVDEIVAGSRFTTVSV